MLAWSVRKWLSKTGLLSQTIAANGPDFTIPNAELRDPDQFFGGVSRENFDFRPTHTFSYALACRPLVESRTDGNQILLPAGTQTAR